MGKTMAEQIFSWKNGRYARAGDIVIADVDLVMFHDGNRPLPLDLLAEMGVDRVHDPGRYVLVLDHYPSPNETVAEVHKQMRQFAREQGCLLYEVGAGISHQLLMENGHVLPGSLIIGADSHTCTYGALGAFGTGVGSSDVAAALATGKLWFRVPETLRFHCRGELPPGVFARDLILYIIGRMGIGGAAYMAVEFGGEAISRMGMDGRFTIANMAVEMGAKAGLIATDATTEAYVGQRARQSWLPVVPDPDACYAEVIDLDVSRLKPLVALPHQVDQVQPVSELTSVNVQQVVIGTCTAARVDDLAIAARILAGRRVSPEVRCYVIPSSRQVLRDATSQGIIQTLLDAGVILGVPGCSGCVGGAHFAVPAAGENVVTTANRNFLGRLGNSKASLYLASPATAAASSLTGYLTDPRPYLEGKS